MWQQINNNLNILAHPLQSIDKFLNSIWTNLMTGLGLCSFFALLLSLILWQCGWDEGAKKLGFPAILIFILSGVF